MHAVVADDNDRLVAVGVDLGLDDGRVGAAAWLSLDGGLWTRVPHEDVVFGGPVEFAQMTGVTVWGPGFVAVGSSATEALEALPNFFRLPFPNEAFAARESDPDVGSRGAVWTSPDGLLWTRVPDAQLPAAVDEDVQLFAVATHEDTLVAVGWRGEAESLDPVVWTSSGGETWSVARDETDALRNPGGQLMADTLSSGSGLVAVGAGGSGSGFNAAVWTFP